MGWFLDLNETNVIKHFPQASIKIVLRLLQVPREGTEEAGQLCMRRAEINNEKPSARLEHAVHLGQRLVLLRRGQVMQDQA